MVEIKNVTKRIKDKVILDDLSLSIPSNQVTTLIGPSGVGKSTLLRIINGLTPFDDGEVLMDGEAIDYHDKKAMNQLPEAIGLVFQELNLYPHLTVYENITLAPRLKKKLKMEEIGQLANLWLKRLKIDDKKDHYPNQLSGGEKQRVAIARAVILNPKLLCFDEPTSALDPLLVREVATLIRELATSMGILIVTHDMNFAEVVSDRIIVLNHGKIESNQPVSNYFSNELNHN